MFNKIRIHRGPWEGLKVAPMAHALEKKHLLNGGPIDSVGQNGGPMDGQTDTPSYRDTQTHLKTLEC